MKQLLSVFLFLALACNQYDAPKPKILIDEEIVKDIMYDLAILQAVKSTGEYVLTDNSLTVNNLLHNKYKIDEKTWLANNKYYASNVRKYNKMVKAVQQKIEKQKNEMALETKKKIDNKNK